MKGFLVMDIGCLECGESSSVVGIYATKKAADKAAESYLDPEARWGRAEWHGQHSVEVFDLREFKVKR